MGSIKPHLSRIASTGALPHEVVIGRASPLSTPHSLSTSSLTFGAAPPALTTSASTSCLPVSQLLWPSAGQTCQCMTLQKQVLRLRRELDAAEATAQSALKLTRISEQDLEEERHALQEVEIQAQSARESAEESASQLKAMQQRARQAEQRVQDSQQELQRVRASLASVSHGSSKAAGLEEEVSVLRRQLEAARKKEALTADAAAKQRAQYESDLQQAWASVEDLKAELRSSQSRHADNLHSLRSANAADQHERELALRAELERERYEAQQAEEQWAADKQHLQGALQELRAEIQVLRSQQTESEAGERTVTELQGRLSQAEVDRDRARDELSQFIEDFTTVQSEARQWQERSMGLEQELADLRWQHDKFISDSAAQGPTVNIVDEDMGTAQPVLGRAAAQSQMQMTRAVSEGRRESEVFDIYSEVSPADVQTLRQTIGSHPDFGYQRRMSPSISDDVFAVSILDADDIRNSPALPRRESAGCVVSSVSSDLDPPKRSGGFPTFDDKGDFEVEEADVQYHREERFEVDLIDDDTGFSSQESGMLQISATAQRQSVQFGDGRRASRTRTSRSRSVGLSGPVAGSFDDDGVIRMP